MTGPAPAGSQRAASEGDKDEASPLTAGTAGHIDHGKTALVRAMTGVDTDRLPEEQARGMTIALGFAPLRLPSGRALSLVDVPGHERLVRVMVSGATGIDLFLLVIAADDGVMPQTIEHIRVLRALAIDRGVVAVTKSDLADPTSALRVAAELMPQAEVVACSARTGQGVAEVVAALERVALRATPRSGGPGGAVLHIDRVFSIRGAGTVVTGTLWSGSVGRGDRLRLLPAGREVRVRGVQVHDRTVEAAAAGQRVAVNLAGVEVREVARGDTLAGAGALVSPAYRFEVELSSDEPLRDRERLQVHHGTRAVPARAVHLDADRWQIRAERPLVLAPGDRMVLRRISPPGTLGGAVVSAAGRRSPSQPAAAPAVARAAARPELPPLEDAALQLEMRLRAAGREPPLDGELGEAAAHLVALRAHGRVVRIGRSMHAHRDAVAGVREVVESLVAREGAVTLARLRDELGTSRKYAQAFLEHLDASHVTVRRPDDSRVLRRRPGLSAS